MHPIDHVRHSLNICTPVVMDEHRKQDYASDKNVLNSLLRPILLMILRLFIYLFVPIIMDISPSIDIVDRGTVRRMVDPLIRIMCGRMVVMSLFGVFGRMFRGITDKVATE